MGKILKRRPQILVIISVLYVPLYFLNFGTCLHWTHMLWQRGSKDVIPTWLIPGVVCAATLSPVRSKSHLRSWAPWCPHRARSGFTFYPNITTPSAPPSGFVWSFFFPHFSSSHASYNMKACRKLKVVVFISRVCHILYLLRSEYWQQRPNRIRTPWPSCVSRLFHDWIWSGILRSTSKQFVVPWLVQFSHQGR